MDISGSDLADCVRFDWFCIPLDDALDWRPLVRDSACRYEIRFHRRSGILGRKSSWTDATGSNQNDGKYEGVFKVLPSSILIRELLHIAYG